MGLFFWFQEKAKVPGSQMMQEGREMFQLES